MLKIIENESEIENAELQFIKIFEKICTEKIKVKIGHLGESYDEEVLWFDELGIWMFSKIIPGSRHWNAFGMGKPKLGSNVSITVEINSPLSGINKRIGGAFAKENSSNIYVVHRGNIGGGRKGIGKVLFENNYQGNWSNTEDGDKVVLIGSLNSEHFAKNISQFVHEINRIKNLI